MLHLHSLCDWGNPASSFGGQSVFIPGPPFYAFCELSIAGVVCEIAVQGFDVEQLL